MRDNSIRRVGASPESTALEKSLQYRLRTSESRTIGLRTDADKRSLTHAISVPAFLLLSDRIRDDNATVLAELTEEKMKEEKPKSHSVGVANKTDRSTYQTDAIPRRLLS